MNFRLIRMKWTIALMTSCIFCTPIHAVDFGRIGMAGLGFASGIYFHELGHAATTWAVGGEAKEINFTSTSIDLPSNLSTEDRKEKLRMIYLSGYIAQTLATEFVLDTPSLHENDYAIGFMSVGILNNLNNIYSFYIKGNKKMDLGLYENAGGDPAIPAFAMGLYSIVALYRMTYQTPISNHISQKMLGLTFQF